MKGRGTSSGEVTWSGVKGKEKKGKERKRMERKVVREIRGGKGRGVSESEFVLTLYCCHVTSHLSLPLGLCLQRSGHAFVCTHVHISPAAHTVCES